MYTRQCGYNVSIGDRVSLRIVNIRRLGGNRSELRERTIPWKSTKRKTKHLSKVNVARLSSMAMLLC